MRKEIPQSEIERQAEITRRIAAVNAETPRAPLAMVDTYGCQQNEADSEKIRGMLHDMGYAFTSDEFEADVIVVNTCAVREHAEMRVLGNVGHLNHTKKQNPGQLIILCGCMAQQEHIKERVKNAYPIVDLLFGPHELWRFPELLQSVMKKPGEKRRRVFEIGENDAVCEGLPAKRDGDPNKAWLSVMYGCNNFCSYCVVPYVRGRERSRLKENILKDARLFVDSGVKDITLLGQNVNSYGRDLGGDVDFASLIEEINAIPGDFLIRFMTSHPKDAGSRLFETMAKSEKCARHLHLPVQAGNDRVLREMNRGYTASKYLELLALARELMPGLVVTSDIIVGFPGETDEEFEDTLRLIETARFDSLFTFLYSPRQGTRAASMPDPFTREQKQKRFDRLVETQNRISAEKHSEYVGKTLRVLVDEGGLTARTNGGRLVHLDGGDEFAGRYIEAEITGSSNWALFGRPAGGRHA